MNSGLARQCAQRIPVESIAMSRWIRPHQIRATPVPAILPGYHWITGRAVEVPRYTTDRIDTAPPVRETVSIGARRTVVGVGKTQLDVATAGIARRVRRSIETTPARAPV